jgi:hypothetical protein
VPLISNSSMCFCALLAAQAWASAGAAEESHPEIATPHGAANSSANSRSDLSAASAPFARVLLGDWTYRSFRNDPDPNASVDDLLFANGRLSVDAVEDGRLSGRLDFGPRAKMTLKGSVTYGEPPTLRLQGLGTPGPDSDSADWVYDYRAYLVLEWPHGQNQRPALVGSVIRSQPHGTQPAGVVASFIALKRDPTDGATAFDASSAESARGRLTTPSEQSVTGLRDLYGRRRLLAEFVGQPTVLLLIQGAFCEHCLQQVATFTRELDRQAIQVVVVSATDIEDLGNSQFQGITVLTDEQHQLFREFGAYDGGPKHGAILLAADGRPLWKHVGDNPLTDVGPLKAAMRALLH